MKTYTVFFILFYFFNPNGILQLETIFMIRCTFYGLLFTLSSDFPHMLCEIRWISMWEGKNKLKICTRLCAFMHNTHFFFRILINASHLTFKYWSSLHPVCTVQSSHDNSINFFYFPECLISHFYFVPYRRHCFQVYSFWWTAKTYTVESFASVFLIGLR